MLKPANRKKFALLMYNFQMFTLLRLVNGDLGNPFDFEQLRD